MQAPFPPPERGRAGVGVSTAGHRPHPARIARRTLRAETPLPLDGQLRKFRAASRRTRGPVFRKCRIQGRPQLDLLETSFHPVDRGVHPRRNEFCKNLFYDAVCPRADQTAASGVIALESATLLCFCRPPCRNLRTEWSREKTARAFDSVIDHFIDLSGMRRRHEIVAGGGLASVDARHPPSSCR
jgi:hypothetical protein